MNRNKPIVGISIGDINGIGLEVIIKSLLDNRIFDFCTPVVYGSSKVVAYHQKPLDNTGFSFNIIKYPKEANPKRANLINCWIEEIPVVFGKENETGGKYALKSLDAALKDIKSGYIQALVTAPLSKKAVSIVNKDFTGHTDYIKREFNASDNLMLMVGDFLKIGLVTVHVPLSEVSALLSQSKIISKVQILDDSLKKDFGILKPKIAVLGLNPHAGESGLIGKEELEVITPAVNQIKSNGIIIYGPYSADGFFGSGNFKNFDAVLAMYHDQALIPFKYMHFGNGVNFTAGIDIVRTSPDHGVGFDIAGKNCASEESFRQAIYKACDIYAARTSFIDSKANKLSIKELEQVEE